MRFVSGKPMQEFIILSNPTMRIAHPPLQEQIPRRGLSGGLGIPLEAMVYFGPCSHNSTNLST